MFTSGSFDLSVYNTCTLSDTTGTRLRDVEAVVSEIDSIFTVLPGLHLFSTFLQQNKIRYKITVNNISWK